MKVCAIFNMMKTVILKLNPYSERRHFFESNETLLLFYHKRNTNTAGCFACEQ